MSGRSRTTAALGAACAIIAITIVAMAGPSAADPSGPTCSDTLEIEVHGQHIVGDYVTGIGHHDLDWPPRGQVGAAVAGEGVAIEGGPGPGFHFPNGIPPGASFCNPQAQSANAVEHQQATRRR